MYRLSILILTILLQCSFVSLLSAGAAKVRVGIYNNKPLIYADDSGRGKGFFADIIEYVADKEGWQIEYVPGTWKESLTRLENNELDILCTIAFSEERDKLYDFTRENLLTNWGQLYTPTGSAVKAVTDVSGRKVAVLKGDIHYRIFTQILDRFGIECEILEVDDYHTVLDLVSDNQVDAGIVNRFFGMKYGTTFDVEQSGVIFNPIKIHYAVPEKENEELLATIDDYIRLLKEDEQSQYYQSLNKWFEVISPGQSLPPWIQWVSAATLGLVALLFLGNLILRNGVKVKTKELTTELNRRKQTEKALQEANNIINRSPAVAFLWQNKKGWPVEFVSENVLDLFGYSTEEFISGKVAYAKVVHSDDLARVREEVAVASYGDTLTTVSHKPYRIVTKDGSVHWLDDRTYIRRDLEGNITHFEGVVLDITDSIMAAEKLRESQERLVRSKKMESLGFLAGGVAHDLNNVLSGIVSYPDLLLMDLPQESKIRGTLETIKESGDRAVAIVQDLLTVARGVATTREPLDLNNLIADYLASPEFRKLKHFHPWVGVKTSFDPDLLNICGSGVHLRKLVMNLVSNASEAIERSGTVTISTSNYYVDVSPEEHGDIIEGEYVVLEVSDDGLGISRDELERIFEPFYTKKVMGRSGTGLGLAVVWNVIQDHKGYIDVKSNENGTVFELFLPVTREKILEKDLSTPLNELKGNGETILVVDDVESQRNISCMLLEKIGYKTVAAASGEDAVEYLRNNEAELILLDMIMAPGINGRQTYERILKSHPGQKAIIVSGYAETDEVKGAQKLGAGRFINKPLTLAKTGLAVKEELAK